ncbi:MAG: LptF/LptG family permease [Bacteroidales bacterium]|nr:LptF/LptG family permease [Bacteroidales bacterium]
MALIIVIVITFDVSEKLDDFLNNHAPFSAVAFDYYLNFIPGFINLYSALFIFISVIFFTSKMAGNTEIIAILGSGISYNRLMRPFLHGSIIIALIVFVFGNFVLPISNRHLIEFEQTYIYTRHDNYYNNIHFQQHIGTQVYVDNFDINNRIAHKFHRDTYNENRQLIERESAETIVYDTLSHRWICYGYFHRTVDGINEVLTMTHIDTLDLGLTPDDFNQKSKPIETMNSIELYKHIQHEKMRGSKNVIEAQIELDQRLFNPLAIIIMTIIAVAVSSRKTRGGIGMHLAIGITLAFAFVVFMKVTTVFATNGNLPPLWAVLLPQLVFGIASVFLVRNAPK